VFLRRLGEQVDQKTALAPRRRLGGYGEQGGQFCPGAWTPRRRLGDTLRTLQGLTTSFEWHLGGGALDRPVLGPNCPMWRYSAPTVEFQRSYPTVKSNGLSIVYPDKTATFYPTTLLNGGLQIPILAGRMKVGRTQEVYPSVETHLQ
jgi:hypothetical protein